MFKHNFERRKNINILFKKEKDKLITIIMLLIPFIWHRNSSFKKIKKFEKTIFLSLQDYGLKKHSNLLLKVFFIF